MDIIGLISFSVFLVILVALSYTAIAFGIKNKKLMVEVVQLNIDKTILLDRLDKALNKNESQSLEKTDGFLKFLSESRDWAFKYIEDVQGSISSLKIAVESGYNTEEELQKLFELLPDNNKENNNEQGND
jgi:hypothetical protein